MCTWVWRPLEVRRGCLTPWAGVTGHFEPLGAGATLWTPALAKGRMCLTHWATSPGPPDPLWLISVFQCQGLDRESQAHCVSALPMSHTSNPNLFSSPAFRACFKMLFWVLDERKISGMILGSKFLRKRLTERGHSYKPCLRVNGWTGVPATLVSAYRYTLFWVHQLQDLSGSRDVHHYCPEGQWPPDHPPGNLASTELPGKHPWRTKKRRLCTHRPNHNSKNTWMISGGDPQMTPAYENHGTHPCGGLGQWFSTLGHNPFRALNSPFKGVI